MEGQLTICVDMGLDKRGLSAWKPKKLEDIISTYLSPNSWTVTSPESSHLKNDVLLSGAEQQCFPDKPASRMLLSASIYWQNLKRWIRACFIL